MWRLVLVAGARILAPHDAPGDHAHDEDEHNSNDDDREHAPTVALPPVRRAHESREHFSKCSRGSSFAEVLGRWWRIGNFHLDDDVEVMSICENAE